jgi:hypothetical protein
MRSAILCALAACSHAPPADGSDAAGSPDACSPPALAIPLEMLVGHNTSAYAQYDQAHFPTNFGTSTWVTQAGATMPVDPTDADLSLNPVTPGHVSGADVHTLVPSRPDLRWFAHVVPWFSPTATNHIHIGLDNNSGAWVAAMLADVERRGFDGIVIDWYGQDSYVDQVTRLVQQQLAAGTSNLTFIVMADKGIAGLSESVLEQQIHYLETQYFGDAHYEHDGGKPILMFFGVMDTIGAPAMATAKSHTAAAVWVVQGTGALGDAWVDQTFDWVHDWHTGPSATDPYNTAGVKAYYAAVRAQSKHAFGGISGGFDGMLTNTIAWSKGKYLPRGDGACLIENATQTDAVIPANVTRMQYVTWDDWEEGSAGEPGIENHVAVAATRDGSQLQWSITGDERTIDHYAIYATDGTSAAALGTVPAGTHAFDLGCGAASAMVIAVGKPMIRDHASNVVP